MNQAHLHLLLNHIPILGSLFGLLLLLSGLACKSRPVRRSGLITLFVVSLMAIPAFLTGEGAEESVERIAGVSDHFIEKHEELAEIAFWFMMVTGALALLAVLWSFFNKGRHTALSLVVAFLALVTFGFMAQVSHLGGMIRHSEVRNSEFGFEKSRPSNSGVQEKADD